MYKKLKLYVYVDAIRWYILYIESAEINLANDVFL